MSLSFYPLIHTYIKNVLTQILSKKYIGLYIESDSTGVSVGLNKF